MDRAAIWIIDSIQDYGKGYDWGCDYCYSKWLGVMDRAAIRITATVTVTFDVTDCRHLRSICLQFVPVLAL